MSNFAIETFVICDMKSPRMLPFLSGTVAAYSRCCPGKESPNEDSMAVISVGDDSGVLIVADGMGGARAGGQASAIVIKCIASAIAAATESPEVRDDLRVPILDGIEQANSDILDLGVGAGTTVSVVEINQQLARSYHVGDSMIQLVSQRGRIKFRTVPHSPVGYAQESGLIDEQQAMHHDERHIVNNFVGDEEMRIEIGAPTEISSRDTLVVASDGLSDNLLESEICDVVRTGDLRLATNQLVTIARERMDSDDPVIVPGKPDDLSMLVYRPST